MMEEILYTREEFIEECEMIFQLEPYNWSEKEAKEYAVTMAEVYYDDDPTWHPEDAIREDVSYWD